MGKHYFVSRHQGAHDWLEQEGIKVDVRVEHLDLAQIESGDVVIGTLPINIVAVLCKNNVRYLHLSLHLPPELRGQELDATQIRNCGACLEEYRAEQVIQKDRGLL